LASLRRICSLMCDPGRDNDHPIHIGDHHVAWIDGASADHGDVDGAKGFSIGALSFLCRHRLLA